MVIWQILEPNLMNVYFLWGVINHNAIQTVPIHLSIYFIFCANVVQKLNHIFQSTSYNVYARYTVRGNMCPKVYVLTLSVFIKLYHIANIIT